MRMRFMSSLRLPAASTAGGVTQGDQTMRAITPLSRKASLPIALLVAFVCVVVMGDAAGTQAQTTSLPEDPAEQMDMYDRHFKRHGGNLDFAGLDVNRDDVIDPNEWRGFVEARRLARQGEPDPVADTPFEALDLDEDGVLDGDEFARHFEGFEEHWREDQAPADAK